MKRTTLCASLAAAALFAGAAQSAEITIYKQPHFSGAAINLRGEVPDLAKTDFNDQASSLVLNGRFEVCTQPNFKGDCRILEPGRYATLDRVLNHRIESIREVAPQRQARREARERDRLAWSGGRDDRRGGGSIELYARPGFEGRALRLEHDAGTLEASRLEDRISSVIVNDGTWQLCTDAQFEGRCRVFEPGQYADLGRLDNRVASARRLR